MKGQPIKTLEDVEQKTLNAVNTVIRVNYALELLKFFCDDGSGQGAPVEISLLPDFVIDFDLGMLINGRYQEIVGIGGRAARIARDLAMLRNDKDGTFSINLFSKTDDVGRAVLKQKLQDEIEEKSLHPIDLAHISKGDRSRVAFILDNELTPDKPKVNDELSADDLEGAAEKRIKNSSVVIISSIKTPSFEKLFHRICKLKQDDQGSVIIDTTRVTASKNIDVYIKKLVKVIKKNNRLQNNAKMKKVVAAILILESELRAIYKEWPGLEESTGSDVSSEDMAEAISQSVQIPVLLTRIEGVKKSANWIDSEINEKIIVPFPDTIDGKKIDVYETFKAGFLLAYATKKALSKWSNKGHEDCVTQWLIDTETVLLYGTLLCGAFAQEAHEHPDKHALLKFAGEVDESTFEQSNVRIESQDLWQHDSSEEAEKALAGATNEAHLGLFEMLMDFKPEKIYRSTLMDTLYERSSDFPYAPKEPGQDEPGRLDKSNSGSLLTAVAAVKTLKHLRKQDQGNFPTLLDWAKKNRGVDPEERRVILVDLDSTLIDSTEVRRRALGTAFDELVKLIAKPQNSSSNKLFALVSALVQFYESAVYDRWPLYVNLIQELQNKYPELRKESDLGDFRQKWNLSTSYAVFLVLLHYLKEDEPKPASRHREPKLARSGLDKDDLAKLYLTLGDNLANSPTTSSRDAFCTFLQRIQPESTKDDIRKQIESFKYKDLLKRFIEDIRSIENRFSEEISVARRAFFETELDPYKEAWEFVGALGSLSGAEIYIATEGNQSTQILKIRQSGLGQIPERHVLSTGLVSKPEIDLANLRNLKSTIEQSIPELEMGIRQAKNEELGVEKVCSTVLGKYGDDLRGNAPLEEIKQKHDTFFDEGRKKIEKLESELADLRNSEKMFEHLDKLYSKFERKDMKAFYALILYAIEGQPEIPQDFLKTFNEVVAYKGKTRSIGERSQMKVAMVGDRFKNDIKPLSELLGNSVITIRMLTEKYAREVVPPKDAPDYEVGTLAEAQALLLTESVWERVDYMPYPVILDYDVDGADGGKDLLDMLSWSFMQDKSFAMTLASLIIEEKCAQADEASILIDGLTAGLHPIVANRADLWSIEKLKSYLEIGDEAARHLKTVAKDNMSLKTEQIAEDLGALFSATFISLSGARGTDQDFNRNIDDMHKLTVDGLRKLGLRDAINEFYGKVRQDEIECGPQTLRALRTSAEEMV